MATDLRSFNRVTFTRSLLPGWIAILGWAVLLLTLSGCGSSDERAQSHYQGGVKFLASNENEKAAVEFRNAVKLRDDFLPAWRGLAQAERAVRDAQGLVSALRNILKYDPSDQSTRTELGKLLLANGAADEALKLADEAAAPQGANILALKALIFLRLRDNATATREAQSALAIDPGNADALKVLAAGRLAANDPQSALQYLSRVASTSTDDIGIAFLKTKIYEKLGDFAELETLLRHLEGLYSTEPVFRRELTKLLLKQNRLADAEKELRKLITADSKNSELGLELVRLLYTTQGPDAAKLELQSRIAMGGDVFPYEMALADVYYKEGNDLGWSNILKQVAQGAKVPAQALAAKAKLAELYVGRKEYDLAETLVSEILRDDSFAAWKNHAGAYKLRALIRLDRNEAEAAIGDLLSALNAQPRSADVMMLLAVAYERTGAIQLSEKEYADAFRVSKPSASVGLKYAEFLRRHGRMKRAEGVLTELAGQLPGNVAVLSALAQTKIARQDWSGAEEISVSIRRLGEKTGLAGQILGEALSGQRKFEASIAALRDAVADAPSAVQPMRLLVATLVGANHTDQAISFLQNVLASSPTNAEAHVLLGTIRLANNAPEQARQEFSRAIDSAPTDIVGYRALASFYLKTKDVNAATAVIRTGLARNPQSSALHMTLAEILELAADYEGAISEYENVMKDEPGSIIAANNLASLLADHRNDSASLAKARSLAARLRQSDVPQFKDTLGWVSYRGGDTKVAVLLLKEAAAALPNQPLVHYHLAMCYVSMGERGRASDELAGALAKGPDTDLKKRIEKELAKLTTQ